MTVLSRLCARLLLVFCLVSIGCMDAPGRPSTGSEVPRPEQVLDFTTLYRQNCAGCHGENGKNGVAISLANPVYLAIAGEPAVRNVVAKGVVGKLMPPFEKSAGGLLTGRQVDSLVHGIFQIWSRSNVLSDAHTPSYAATTQSDPLKGQRAFDEFCASCHGADGNGVKSAASSNPNAVPGSIVDVSYLALVTDQNLRSTIIAGRPDQGMPDWRSDATGPRSRAMSDQEIADIVAWLAAHRAVNPERPYASQR